HQRNARIGATREWRWGSGTLNPVRSFDPVTTPGSRFRQRASEAAGVRTMTKKKPESASSSTSSTTSGRASSDRELNHTLLRSMLLQRRFEERTAEAYALGKIGGFCHLYIGQEAVSTGTLSVIRPDDYV